MLNKEREHIMKTKSIKFELVLNGHGVVQTDGRDKALGLKNSKSGIFGYQENNNITYAKGNFEYSEGKIKKILKISGDGLRHAIHINSHFAHAPNLLINTASRMNHFSSMDSILRGYLSMNTEERKTSAYTITSAEDKNALTSLELFSNSSPKSETSLFSRETVGDTNYLATGFVNIEELRFISISDIFGRRAVQDDSAETFRKGLSKRLGSDVSEPAYYVKGDSIDVPERGIVLSDEQITKLVSYLFENMAEINITKSQNGYARTNEIRIKSIEVPTKDYNKGFDLLYSEATGEFNKEKIPTEYFNSWTLVDKDVAIQRIQTVENELKESKEQTKIKKAQEKQQKAAAKSKKNLEPEE